MQAREFDITGSFLPADVNAWRALVEGDLKGAPFERKLVTHTYEGLHIQPLYTRADAQDRDEFSGLMPFTRAARALGTSRAGWELRQERSEADPAAANIAIREDLEGGVNGIVLRLDACARSSHDPVNEGALLAARDGIAAYTTADLERVLDGVHVQMISVGIEAGAAFCEAAAALAALWEARAVPDAEARGCFQADPLAVLARDGQLPYSLASGLARMARLAAWTSSRYPRVCAVRVGTAPYHHAGATATQDLAFSMATGLEYLRAMESHGLGIDAAAGQIEFSYAVGCNLFLAIAKLRAARRLWARVVEACAGGTDARRMRMYARPSKRVMTTRDPWVNMLRNTACVFAAGVGGADAIASTPFDSTLGEPSELGRRVARNTHHLMIEECRVHEVCDAAGGSWYIERLTDELCEKAWEILQAIEGMGGMGAALQSRWVVEQIDSATQPRLKNIATRKDVIVGVSDFPDGKEPLPARPPVDRGAIARAAATRLSARGEISARAPRHEPDPQRPLDWALQAAKASMSIGEMHRHLRRADAGEPAHLSRSVHVHAYAEPFERLRDAADEHARTTGARPKVCLCAVGPVARRLARVNYCRNVFEAGGFEIIGGEGPGDVDGCMADFSAGGAPIAVICGGDEDYKSIVPALAPALHWDGARRVILAGNPGAHEAAYRAAGVDDFVYIKCDVVALLSALLALEGVAL